MLPVTDVSFMMFVMYLDIENERKKPFRMNEITRFIVEHFRLFMIYHNKSK